MIEWWMIDGQNLAKAITASFAILVILLHWMVRP